MQWNYSVMLAFTLVLVCTLPTVSTAGTTIAVNDGAAPTPSITSVPQVVGPDSISSDEMKLFTLINAYRVENGRQPLVLSKKLTIASASWSRTMAAENHLYHSASWAARIRATGYAGTALGENVYYGTGSYSDAQHAFDGWKNSAGHNANMLSSSFKSIGIGEAYASGSSAHYWTTDFGSIDDGDNLPAVAPSPTPTPTKTPAPTLTPTPTKTPLPPLTPLPTRTPIPTLTPAPTRTSIPVPTPSITPAPTLSKPTGSLFVVSYPYGASVSIDGKPVGTTPLFLRTVSSGAHVVTIEKTGYASYSKTVFIAAGKTAAVWKLLSRG